ncbi:uncharacterized protein LY79DRAFT_659664 [Colletotrichum navitas]|uniref:Secreted protein n=1 Tax=Colletotrichum navitas TaxID=681940 RepID=A0AAD8PYT1_9PEZI|nr:uncharacterized protein LY79DRAFT_659664 [Colletotrichum navitas]KAK1590152.1 hypothetical protein LY79DRAFT_659664 [Colletotrichum navitas]
MKLSAIANASLILLSLGGPASASSRCLRRKEKGGIIHQITIEDVGSLFIAGTCGRLWDNLKRHPACMVFKPNGCEEAGGQSIYWHFKTSLVCNAGMVHSAFYEATRNYWGAIRLGRETAKPSPH